MLSVVNTFYTLFSSEDWVNYPTVPVDYKGDTPVVPFLRVNIVFADPKRAAYAKTNKKQLEGQLLVQIVTESGRGQKKASEITSELNGLLEETWPDANTQTGLGALQFVGQDPDDDTKSIYQYSLPFTYIGD